MLLDQVLSCIGLLLVFVAVPFNVPNLLIDISLHARSCEIFMLFISKSINPDLRESIRHKSFYLILEYVNLSSWGSVNISS